MKIHWRRSAVNSLIILDNWRSQIELKPIAVFLRKRIDEYFRKQDFSIYIPGSSVAIKGYPANLRMALISIGKSDPYKVFYRISDNELEIFLVRHPRQSEL